MRPPPFRQVATFTSGQVQFPCLLTEKPSDVRPFSRFSRRGRHGTTHHAPVPFITARRTSRHREHRALPNRQVLNAYANNPESKFLGPDGDRCTSYTRGILQRDHVIAGQHRYCGKEFKRKLEHGPVDHEIDSKCKVYENGRVAADAETLRQLTGFSEREIRKATGVRRDTIRLLRHGNGFHGGNMGSNPIGDAKKRKQLQFSVICNRSRGHDGVTIDCGGLLSVVRALASMGIGTICER
jgi:hypothetical protein